MKRFTILLAVFLSAEIALAQEALFNSYSRLLSPEKLYLHTDREVYCIGDTIWFKGYLKNASALAEYSECNYIYVELLLNSDEKNAFTNKMENIQRVQKRVKIKRVNGQFEGFLPLSQDANTGIATLRAYSYWMLNQDPELIFHKDIELRNPMKDEFVQRLIDAKITEQSYYDELHVLNPFRKSILKPKPKKETGLDIQFFPESGRYLADSNSVIGVKAVNSDGLGVKVYGRVSADGTQICTFETNELGMGKFVMNVPTGTSKLEAEVETRTENFIYQMSVPLPEKSAVVINVTPKTDNLLFRCIDSGIDLPDSTFIVIYDKNEIFFKTPYQGNRTFSFEKNVFSAGINDIAVVDSYGNVYAQRCFFIFPDKEVGTSLSLDKSEYKKREKVEGTITISDLNGVPADGEFSISITDDKWAPYSGKGHNIESYFLLGSELEGYIEQPQMYFCDTISLSERVANMDFLMMTQGWKYYDLPKILQGKTTMPQFGKEYTQSLSGWVHGVFGKAKKPSIVYFVAPSINFTLIGDLDTCSRFALNELDFPDSTQFLVGATGTRFLKKLYYPVLDREYFAGLHKYPSYLNKAEYSKEYEDYAKSSYYSVDGELVYTINPSRIIASPTGLSPYPNDDFNNHQFRGREQIEPYDAFDVISYIIMTVPGVRSGMGDNGEVALARRISAGGNMKPGSNFTPVKIYWNGMYSSQEEVRGIMMSEVEAFAWATGLRAAKYGYSMEDMIYPVTTVFIKTSFPIRGPHNVLFEKPIGWQKPAKFYVPKYETKSSLTDFEPMRATLYWNPSLKLTDGKADFEFYTSDSEAPYTVIVEGLTKEGKPLFFKTELKK